MATLRGIRRIVREALRAGERRAARRTTEARRARIIADATALAYARHLDAQLTLATPIMRQAYSPDWWDRATPQDIGAVWEATTSWAAVGDGYAQATLTHLREQTSRRYGVDVRDLRLQPRDVVELLARARLDADTPAPAAGDRMASYLIRDTSTGTVASQHLRLQPPPGVSWGEHAAQQLIEYAGRLEHQAGEPSDGLTDRFRVEVYPGDDVTTEPALTVTGDQAPHVVQTGQQDRDRIVSGIGPASPEQLLDVLRAEEHRLAGEYAHHVDALDLATADALIIHANQAAIAREQLDYTRLRIQAAEAGVRGENATHVFQQASLQARYDDAWWAEATPDEAAVVWRYIAGWSEGAARGQMLADLQTRIQERFGVPIDTDTGPQQVHAALTATAADRDRPAAAPRQDEPARPVASEPSPEQGPASTTLESDVPVAGTRLADLPTVDDEPAELPPLTEANLTLGRLSETLQRLDADDVADTLPAVFDALDNPPGEDATWFADVDRGVAAFTALSNATWQALPRLSVKRGERWWLLTLENELEHQARRAGYPALDREDLDARARYTAMSDEELRAESQLLDEDNDHYDLLAEILERRGLDEFGYPAAGSAYGLPDAIRFDPDSMAGALVRANRGRGTIVIGTVVEHPNTGWWVEGHVEGEQLRRDQVWLRDSRYGPPHVQIVEFAAERERTEDQADREPSPAPSEPAHSTDAAARPDVVDGGTDDRPDIAEHVGPAENDTHPDGRSPAPEAEGEPDRLTAEHQAEQATIEPRQGVSVQELEKRLKEIEAAASSMRADGIYTRAVQAASGHDLLAWHAAVFAEALAADVLPFPVPDAEVLAGVLARLQEPETGDWDRDAAVLEDLVEPLAELAYRQSHASTPRAWWPQNLVATLEAHCSSLSASPSAGVAELAATVSGYGESAELMSAEHAVSNAYGELADLLSGSELSPGDRDSLDRLAAAYRLATTGVSGGPAGHINRYRLLADQAQALADARGGSAAVAAYTLWAQLVRHQARLWAGLGRQDGVRLREILTESTATIERGDAVVIQAPPRPAAAPIWIEHNKHHTIVHGPVTKGDAVYALLKAGNFLFARSKGYWKTNSQWRYETRDGRVRALAKGLALAGRPFHLEQHPPGQQPAPQPPPAPTTSFHLPAGEPFNTWPEAQAELRPLTEAFAWLNRSTAWRHMTSGAVDARPDAQALDAVVIPHPLGADGAEVIDRFTALARHAHTLLENLTAEGYHAPLLLPHLRELRERGTAFAARLNATAITNRWPVVFKAPGPHGETTADRERAAREPETAHAGEPSGGRDTAGQETPGQPAAEEQTTDRQVSPEPEPAAAGDLQGGLFDLSDGLVVQDAIETHELDREQGRTDESVRADGEEALGEVPAGGLQPDRRPRDVLHPVRRASGQPDHGSEPGDRRTRPPRGGVPGEGQAADRGSGAGRGEDLDPDDLGDPGGAGRRRGVEEAHGGDPVAPGRRGDEEPEPSSSESASSPAATRPGRFLPASQDDFAPSTPAARVQANLAAVRVVLSLRELQRPATAEEQRILAKWSGWGAVPEVFDEREEVNGRPGPGVRYADVRRELRALLSPAEYEAAAANTLNAHYTDAEYVQAIWEAVGRLGFALDRGQGPQTTRRGLETSCGSGVFIGFCPDGVDMVGVELEPITASIAQMLYPDAQILNESFAETRAAEGSFDLVIGNVPFGKVKLEDPRHNPSGHNIHNHFLIKALHLTKPGGLVAVITSRYTLDAKNPAVRRELAALGDLVGAIRLPTMAHQRAAGTKVVTDVLILRRREEGREPDATAWELAPMTDVDGGQARVNEYFAAHPGHVLGGMVTGPGSGLYHAGELAVRSSEPVGPALREALADIAVSAAQRDLRWNPAPAPVTKPIVAAAERRRRPDGFIDVTDGGARFTIVLDGSPVPHKVPKTQVRETALFLRLRNIQEALLSLEEQTLDDTPELDALRIQLNDLYDAYRAEFGPLNRYTWSNANRKDPETGEETAVRRRNFPPIGGVRNDPSSNGVFGLEHFDDETQTATKHAIFTSRRLGRKAPRLGADTAHDALRICFDKYRQVRLEEIARLLGCDEDEARAQLGTMVFEDPAEDRLVVAAEYLSGDVRQKLDQAKDAAEADARFLANVDALTEVIPPDKQPEEIRVKLGSPWISPHYVQQFLREIFDDDRLRVGPDKDDPDKWDIQRFRRSAVAEELWGTGRVSAIKIVKAALAQETVRVTDTAVVGKKKKSILNAGESITANEKVSALNLRFSEWVWEDPERARELAATYNKKNNALVRADWSGFPLTLPGITQDYTPRPHQVAAIVRGTVQKSTYLAHAPGAGKTDELIAIAAELVRLDPTRKPCLVVPGNVIDQFARRFAQLYPNLKVLRGSRRTIRGDREKFVAQCASGDYGVILMTYSMFERIPLSQETIDSFARDEALRHVDLSRLTPKQAQTKVANAKERAKSDLRRTRDRGFYFERTAITDLLVDEFHNFKNQPRKSKVAGLSLAGSKRPVDMKAKFHYVRTRYDGRLVGASGTMISNNIGEAHTAIDFFAPELLAERGMSNIDKWAANHTTAVSRLDVSVDGGSLRMKERLRFTNLPALSQMIGYFADVKTAEELNLPTPPIAPRESDGERAAELVGVPPSPELKAYQEALVDRAEDIQHKRVEPTVDNWLRLGTHAREIALDPRLRGLTPTAPVKVDVAADKIAKIYHETKDWVYPKPDGTPHPKRGALQLVFCDYSTPKDDEWNIYHEARGLLVERGVPAGRIRFVQDAKDEAARDRLWGECNDGDVSVVFGSTPIMGVGVNIQTRAYAQHDLDVPWLPAWKTQRDGRTDRDGNLNPEVRFYRYITLKSRDAGSWGLLEYKAGFIGQLMRGEADGEIDDLDDDSLDYAKSKALAFDNPLLTEKTEIDAELDSLRRRAREHAAAQGRFRLTVKDELQRAEQMHTHAELMDAAIARRVDTRGDLFVMTIEGGRFGSRADAWKRLKGVLQRELVLAGKAGGADRSIPLGEIGGFPFNLLVAANGKHLLHFSDDVPVPGFRVSLENLATKSPTGLITKLENQLHAMETRRDRLLKDAERARHDARQAQEQIGKPFPHAERLAELEARATHLQRELVEFEATQAEALLTPGKMAELIGARAGASVFRRAEQPTRVEIRLGQAPDADTAHIRLVNDPDRPFLVGVHGHICPAARRELPNVLDYMAGGDHRLALPPQQAAAFRSRITKDPAPPEVTPWPDRSAASTSPELAAAKAAAAAHPRRLSDQLMTAARNGQDDDRTSLSAPSHPPTPVTAPGVQR